jgi:hypothetical protein
MCKHSCITPALFKLPLHVSALSAIFKDAMLICIILIIILVTTIIKCIYNYILETNHISWIYTFAAVCTYILCYILYFSCEIRGLYFYICTPVGTRFSAPVQTGPVVYPASCTMGTGSFPGVESGRDVTLTPHPHLVPRSKKQSRAIPPLSLRVFVVCKTGETYLNYF